MSCCNHFGRNQNIFSHLRICLYIMMLMNNAILYILRINFLKIWKLGLFFYMYIEQSEKMFNNSKVSASVQFGEVQGIYHLGILQEKKQHHLITNTRIVCGIAFRFLSSYHFGIYLLYKIKFLELQIRHELFFIFIVILIERK